MASRRRVGEEKLYYRPPAMRNCNQQQQVRSKSSSSSSPERRESGSDSNLDRFLEHTTPVVQSQHFPRTSMQAWKNRNCEFHPYFILADLWESFREWSVYGAGVPLVLNGTDSVIQYYVPSLSGIQLYVDPSRNVMEQRPGEESDNSSSSDGDNEGGSEARADNYRGSWNQPSATSQGHNRFTGGNHTFSGSSVDGVDVSDPPGLLIYEYLERELPFHREPLADKMSVLASRSPVLKTFRSCDLTPASWISIAWYPIYRIPVGPTLQNVDACFLSFHSLAKPVRRRDAGRDAGRKLTLPTFGLVSHKFNVSEWDANGVREGEKVASLLRAADNWLQLLQVDHPDFTFFTSRNRYWR
ncbi:hypothetical protein ACS0TY_022556 [Phlomoides rotata]